MVVATFERLVARNGLESIPDGYHHLNWEFMFAVDKGAFGAKPNGYYQALQSGRAVAGTTGDSVILDPHGTFSLESGYFSAAWRTGLKVTFTASNNNVIAGVLHVTLDENQKFITFPASFDNIDEVEITSRGGHAVHRHLGNGNNVAMDNLTLDHFAADAARHAAPDAPVHNLPSFEAMHDAWSHVPFC